MQQRILIFGAAIAVLAMVFGFRQHDEPVHNDVNWMSMEEAVQANAREPRKVLIDVYTDWCGWCKKLDNVTYKDPNVVNYINKHYYAVKLDAEMSDTLVFRNQQFINERPGVRRSAHQFAIALLSGQMSYPATVIMDENLNMITPPIKGYLDASGMLPVLKFFGDNAYKTTSWEEYQKQQSGAPQ